MKRMGWGGAASALVLAAILLAVMPAAAQTPVAAFDPATFRVGLQEVAGGLDRPVYVADPGDGSGRLFVVEQPGTIRIVRDGAVRPAPFLDISELVQSAGNEQGLLSVAFDPGYAENGEFYVGYTARSGAGSGDNTISRYRVSAGDPDRADPASGEVLLAIEDPYPNHNGGLVMFGPDGYLYAGFGDGGGAGDPRENGQNTQALLGKILRLDVHGRGLEAPYAIPPDNPFASGEGGRPEVWAYGLRNPWRFSFDRATGDFYVGDVGQNQYEEIDELPAAEAAGANYGWNVTEGPACYRAESCETAGITLPVASYGHDLGCSVTGGYVYRGSAFPPLAGVYLFADYCTGLLWGLGRDGSGAWVMSEPIETGMNISSFGEDAAGELYATDLRGGLYRVTAG